MLKIETSSPDLPAQAEVDYTFSVKFRFNITPFVARQKVNSYLLDHVGQMISAGEPSLLIGNEVYWKVPIFCAYPEFRRREQLGELAVNAQSGEINLSQSSFASAAEIETRADAIYHSLTTLSAGV